MRKSAVLLLCLFGVHASAQQTTFQMKSLSNGCDLTPASTVIPKYIYSAAGLNSTDVAMYDSFGNLIWSNRYGSTTTKFQVRSIIAGPNGDFFLNAYNVTNGTAMLSRLDSLGNFRWCEKVALASYNRMNYFEGSKKLICTNGTNFFSVTDSLGNVLFSKEYYGNYFVTNDLEESDSNSVVAVGRTVDPSGFWKSFALAVSDTGSILWAKSYGGLSNDEARAVIKSRDGNFLITGYTESYGAGNKDVFLQKITPGGEVLWYKTYGTPAADEGYAIVELSDSTIIIGGSTLGFSTVLQRIAIKISPSGNLVNSKIYAESSFPASTAIKNVYQDTNALYFYSERSSYAYFHKTDWDLNSGCNETSVLLWELSHQPSYTGFISSVSNYTTSQSAIVIPVTPCPNPLTTICSSTCNLAIRVNISNTILCAGDSLYGYCNPGFDSLNWYYDGILISNNDTMDTLLPSPGNHLVKVVCYLQGCPDSVVQCVTVDLPPLINFSSSSSELALYLDNQSANLRSFHWIIDTALIRYEDSLLIGVRDFGSHQVCLVGSNNCSTDTVCDALLLQDSLSYFFYERTEANASTPYMSSTCIKATKDGGAIECGMIAYNSDIFFHRINRDGSRRWTKIYSVGYSLEMPLSVDVCLDNGFICGGVGRSLPNYYGFITKTDSAGQVLWTQLVPASPASIDKVMQLRDSNFVAVGKSGNQLLIMKINWLGQKIWMKTYQGYDYGKSIIELNDGGFLATGMNFGGDIVLLRVDRDGNYLWTKTYGANGTDYGKEIIQSADGGFLTGFFIRF